MLHAHTDFIQSCLDSFVRDLGQQHALSAACAIHLARLKRFDGKWDAAIAAYEPALALYAGDARLRAATEPGALGDHAQDLGRMHMERKKRINRDLPSAKRAFLWALSFRRERLGSLHAATTEAEYRLGVCLQTMGNSEGAEAYFKAAFAHEREAGCEGRIARRCCELHVVSSLMELSERHSAAGRLQRALDLHRMAAAIVEHVCKECLELGDLERVMTGITFRLAVMGDLPAAEDAAKRLVSETERSLGPTHLRMISALAFLAHFYLDAGQLEKAKPYLRRAWDILETALQSGPPIPDPELGDFFLPILWTVFGKSEAVHVDRAAAKSFFKAVLEWTRVNRQPPQGVPIAAVIRALRELESRPSSGAEDPGRKEELEPTRADLNSKRAETAAADSAAAPTPSGPPPPPATPPTAPSSRPPPPRSPRVLDEAAERRRLAEEQKAELAEERKRAREAARRARCSKLEERKREREEQRRAEEERERARREAERAERAARDAADREAARKHVEGSQWALARPLLDALLKRSPDDFGARLLRIQCMAGAGQLEAAFQEAEAAERELADTAAGSGGEPDYPGRLARVEELRRYVAAEQRRREEAKRRAEEEARRRAQEERRERERQAELQRRQQLWREEQARKEARRREQAQRLEQRRREEQLRQAAQAEAAEAAAAAAGSGRHLRQAAPCRLFAKGACRAGARCRYRHEAADGPEASPAAECAICLEPLAAGPPPAALACRHRGEFHGACIEAWRAGPLADGCPLCGAPFAGPSSPAAGAAAGAAPSTPAPARAERAVGPASPAEGSSGASSSSASSPPALQPTPALQPAPGTAGGPAFPSSAPPAAAPPQAARRPTRPYQPPGISFA
eukprot:tig00000670_g3031.t1